MHGRHGDAHAHLASSCASVLLVCPECELELPRFELAAQTTAACDGLRECAYGCGERLAGVAAMAEHHAECAMEPRKLLAALGHLQHENERLLTENLKLRSAREVCAGRALPSMCSSRHPSRSG